MNQYRVVFRQSTVVEEQFFSERNIVKAAKRAERTTRPNGMLPGWSVYSITLS